MRSKEDFINYLSDKGIIEDYRRFSPYIQELIEDVYCSGFITNLAPYLTSKKSPEDIFIMINNEVKDMHEIKYHNVGENSSENYYKQDGVEFYLKVLHYLIVQSYFNPGLNKKDDNGKYVRFDRTTWSASNRKMAIALTILSKEETDPDIIQSNEKKITNALYQIKTKYPGVIHVKQTYNENLLGSGHNITIIYSKLIKLFNNYDPNAEGSICFRKSIRKRIISFIKETSYSWKKAFDNLIKKQKNSYLFGLVSFNVKAFKENVYLLFSYMKRQKWLAIPKSMWKVKNVVPIIDEDHTKLTLKVKNRILMEELSKASKYLISDFKNKFNINLSVVAS